MSESDLRPDDRVTTELTLEPVGESTSHSVQAIHGSRAAAATHRGIGHRDGRGTALDHLIEQMGRQPTRRPSPFGDSGPRAPPKGQMIALMEAGTTRWGQLAVDRRHGEVDAVQGSRALA